MNQLKIYFLYDDELSEYEAINKGFRVDVFVKIDNQFFNLRIYDMIRLQQDFDCCIDRDGYYPVDPNLVLVTEVTKNEIVNTVKNLYTQKYFNEIKPASVVNIEKLIEII